MLLVHKIIIASATCTMRRLAFVAIAVEAVAVVAIAVEVAVVEAVAVVAIAVLSVIVKSVVVVAVTIDSEDFGEQQFCTHVRHGVIVFAPVNDELTTRGMTLAGSSKECSTEIAIILRSTCLQ